MGAPIRAMSAIHGSCCTTMTNAPPKLMRVVTTFGRKVRMVLATMPASPLTR